MTAPTIVCKKCGVATLLSTWTESLALGFRSDCPNCWAPHTDKELNNQTQHPALVAQPAQPPQSAVRITYGASVTVPHPSRSFANSKPTIEISFDCDPNDRDATFAFMKDWVHTAIRKAIQELHEMQS